MLLCFIFYILCFVYPEYPEYPEYSDCFSLFKMSYTERNRDKTVETNK